MQNTIETIRKLTTCDHKVRVTFRTIAVCRECGAVQADGVSSWIVPRCVTMLTSDLQDELPLIQGELCQADACINEVELAVRAIVVAAAAEAPQGIPADRAAELLEQVLASLDEYRGAFADMASRFMPRKLAPFMADFAERIGLSSVPPRNTP